MDEKSVDSTALLESHPSVNPEAVLSEPSGAGEQCCETGKDLRVTPDSPKRSVLVNKDSEVLNVKHSNVTDAQTPEPTEVQMKGQSGDIGQSQSSQHDNLLSELNLISEQHLPVNIDSSKVLSEEHFPIQDNQNTSLTSSPNSCSTSGQDSGLSPDDSGSDIARAHNFEDTANQIQSKISDSKNVKASDLETVEVAHVGQSQASASTDTVTSTSETQVTVSDLDSPSAENTIDGRSALTKSDQESVYYIKWITFGETNVPIITQNENGPCPLLAIMNVLLLKGKVKLAPMLEMVTSEQLMTYLGDCIFENMPQNLSPTSQADYEQNMQDAMSVMHKLQTGLDVNVKFTGVSDFEFTSELIIFDLLGISLYHGWLLDPQDPETVEAVNQDSYNQLVEKIITQKHSDKEEDITQALIAEQFLDRTASQLTYHGLSELSSVVKEDEPCVFFRNNHFSTLYKHNNEMFLLVTDQGFLTESNVVWETLSTVDGDCHFTDATFRTYTKPVASMEAIPEPAVPVGSQDQIDQDFQIALYLHNEASAELNPAWGGGYTQDRAALAQTDHDFAMRLQEEEERRVRAEQQRQAQPGSTHPGGPSRVPPSDPQRRRGEKREKEEKNCRIL